MSKETILFTDMGITDPIYEETVKIILNDKKVSLSYIQRRLRIGYHRASRLIEALESQKIISPIKSNGTRKILISLEDYEKQVDATEKLIQNILKRIEPTDKAQQMIWKNILTSLNIDLEKLNSFDDFNFAHDIFGIRKHYDPQTGILSNHFLPRSIKLDNKKTTS